MCRLSLVMVLVIVTSCSSSQKSNFDRSMENREQIEDSVKEDKIVGKDLPEWTKLSGIEHGHVYVIGTAEFDVNKSEDYVLKAATMDGETKLLGDAPADFRILTQSALTGAGVESGEFYQIQSKLQEVIGVKGVRSSQKNSTCRKVIRYGNLATRTMRRCWVQVSIPVQELKSAYARTIGFKYGEKTASGFKKKMDSELKKLEQKGKKKKSKN